MKIIYFICSSFLFFSCNHKTLKKPDPCTSYFQLIKENWTKNEKGVFDIPDKKIIWNENKGCLIGKTKIEILDIFGEPNKKSENLKEGFNNFGYFLDEGCNKGIKGDCVIFFLHFDEKDKVIFVPVGIIR